MSKANSCCAIYIRENADLMFISLYWKTRQCIASKCLFSFYFAKLNVHYICCFYSDYDPYLARRIFVHVCVSVCVIPAERLMCSVKVDDAGSFEPPALCHCNNVAKPFGQRRKKAFFATYFISD